MFSPIFAKNSFFDLISIRNYAIQAWCSLLFLKPGKNHINFLSVGTFYTGIRHTQPLTSARHLI